MVGTKLKGAQVGNSYAALPSPTPTQKEGGTHTLSSLVCVCEAGKDSTICFLFSVYMQKAVLGPSTRIFLAIRSSWLRDRKILAPCKPTYAQKVLLLETKKKKKGKKERKKERKKHGGGLGIQLLKADNFSFFPSSLGNHPDQNFCM